MEEIIKFNAITLKAIGRDGEMYSLNDLWKMLGSQADETQDTGVLW